MSRPIHRFAFFFSFILLCVPASASDIELAPLVSRMQESCLDCHSGAEAEGGLDLTQLAERLEMQGKIVAEDLAIWIKIHDRVDAGEMPPEGGLEDSERQNFVAPLRKRLVELDREQIESEGRAIWRRINRFEYENSLRDLLHAPWLQLATMLPEDGELHRFNKIGEALDVSHVNFARYMQAADFAMRAVMEKTQEPPELKIKRYYAREQASFNRRVHFTIFNRSPERATFPLLGYEADLDVLRDPETPFTVGDSDPAKRELEAFGVVASSYEPIEISFSSFVAPRAGHYKLRFKGYTFWAAGEEKKWWRPDREKTARGRRSEPVVIYSRAEPRQLRRLGEFDFQVEPSVQELDVWLLKGEKIQPDAVRLFRSRPPNWHNPLAEKDGMPGVAFNWMEVEGPIIEQWPSAGHQLLLDDLETGGDGNTNVATSQQRMQDARRLMRKFLGKAYTRPTESEDVERFVGVVEEALGEDMPFADAMLAGYTAALCSPGFLCLEEHPGRLDAVAVANRLSLFLWNSLPDSELRQLAESGELNERNVLEQQVERMLNDEKSRRFVDAFLAYWLDLRKINDTSPDEVLYPDYYLDDALVDAALEETQLFFAELVSENLPAKNLIDSDFTFANERLADHYGLPPFEGARLQRVALPEQSVRGGLLTQASILKVTANGSTTSPVVRGAWINERILGIDIPPPPPSVPAIEPDTRGATTIRQQLFKHRADESCNVCHKVMDPAGFALESFDVAGGFRDTYRSLQKGDSVPGYGKNGQPFTFTHGPQVDASGELPDGRPFADVAQLKRLLLADQRKIAKNLVEKLLTYATGAAPRFSDREEIEEILDRHAAHGYPVRSLITEIATSRLFLNK
ncbi:DUF1592 domain-containing protein [Aureliella helgolandensis]|uniref:Planctomycete cytochrome C n=1 Tax=Aureliella helgolandensis TaxID=2527968 RepID=A0A518G887_9BACT|nr:DUF1592 domain-containing protein [Aureliella helgolandensis]QDV24800.1 Planctomycete cytochrome C [Aureliella helgolandensis]